MEINGLILIEEHKLFELISTAVDSAIREFSNSTATLKR